jgi:signal transduction histidine kinase
LFAKRPLDLIVSIGAPAADFVQRHRRRLFPATPMVLTAVDQRRVQYSNLTGDDVAVAVNINYLSAFENILQVLPDTKDVIVVVGTSPIEKFWKEAIGKQAEPLTNRIKLSWTDELPFGDLLKQASALPPHTAIFWELMIVDAAGVVHEGDLPLERLHAVANAPIFSYDESFFGSAIVGGPLLIVADTSRLTGYVGFQGRSPIFGEARDAMNNVVATGHHASDVITNVRELFAKDTQEKTPTDVNKLIGKVLALVYIDLRKHSIETQLNLSEQLPPLIGNEVQLRQVVLNLVMNAIESMVSVAEPRVLSIKSESTEHNSVLVSIADTGSGIDVANLNRIFAPMFTTKTRGMGMGLSICKSIIDSHNGGIWVSAGVPRGAIFHFELPLRKAIM